MSYLRYLCLFSYSDVQHILCCVFVLFSSSCVTCVASFSGLSILIAPSVFPNVNYKKIFSLIFDTGILPEAWLIGNMIPIFKKTKGSKLDSKNYRPITLLSCIGKIVTSILNVYFENSRF